MVEGVEMLERIFLSERKIKLSRVQRLVGTRLRQALVYDTRAGYPRASATTTTKIASAQR